MFCNNNFCRQYDMFLEASSLSNKKAPQRIVHGTRLSYCIAVLWTSLLKTCGHLIHWTSTRLTMPSGPSCRSVSIRPKFRTSMSCDSVLSPCGVAGTARCSDAECDILNITQAYKLLVRILCRYFNAFMQTFQCSCEKVLFSDFTW